MRYRDSQLVGVPVYAEAGGHLGRLVGFVIDADTHEIIQYAVRKSGAIEKLLPKELLVHRNQVVSVSEEKMVVRDAAVLESEEAESKGRIRETSAKPAGAARSMD